MLIMGIKNEGAILNAWWSGLLFTAKLQKILTETDNHVIDIAASIGFGRAF